MNRNFVKNLDQETLLQLNKRIRDAGYGQSVAIAEWLTSEGHIATKSGVHRYSVKLKLTDGITAPSGSFDAIIAASGDGGPKTEALSSLFEQLGRLEYQKTELLQKISRLKGLSN